MSDWRSRVVDVPDFPKPGIVFKDITPALADAAAFGAIIDEFCRALKANGRQVDAIVGVESRGFIFGAAIAQALDVGLVLVRKPGKLPRATYDASYSLEYGQDSLHIHTDALETGAKAWIIDDVLATGGTAAAVCELVSKTGAEVAGLGFLMEISFLNGRSRLPDSADVVTLEML